MPLFAEGDDAVDDIEGGVAAMEQWATVDRGKRRGRYFVVCGCSVATEQLFFLMGLLLPLSKSLIPHYTSIANILVFYFNKLKYGRRW